MNQPQQPGQPPGGMPQQQNPALSGQPQGQPGMAQPQYPQQQQYQQPQQSGLVDPQQRPVSSQQYGELRLRPDGPALPCPVGSDGQMGPESSMNLVGMMGGQAPASIILTWVEVSLALSMRDLNFQWLERRVADLEKAAGATGIPFEQFMAEKQQEYAAEMAAHQQEQAQQAQAQTQQAQVAQAPQGQAPGGHGMPGGHNQ